MRVNPLLNQKINQGVLFLIPLAFMIVTPWPLSELSLWVGYGERLWSDWHFLYQDNVSILPTDNNTTSSWLLSLIYFGLYRLGGIYLVSHFHHLALLLILALVYCDTLFRNPWPWPWKERLSIYAVWLGSGAYFSLRPALIAFVPFFLSYRLLEKRVSARSPLNKKDWLHLTVLQIFWVNLHGSFVLLPMMVGWVLLAQRGVSTQRWLGLLAVLVCTFINPFGVSIFEYVLKTREYSQFLGISEWVSALSLEYPLQSLLYWSLLIFTLGFLWRSLRKNHHVLSSPFIPLVILPLFGLRLSTFTFCALPCFLFYHGPLFRTRAKTRENISPIGPLLALILITIFLVMGSPYLKAHFQAFLPARLQSRFDSASIFAISERLQQVPEHCPILNDFNVGGFLMMTTGHPLLIDGRVTPFTKESLKRYSSFMKGQDVGILIQETNPCFAVLSLRTSEALIQKLLNQFQFSILGIENDYVLMERTKQD